MHPSPTADTSIPVLPIGLCSTFTPLDSVYRRYANRFGYIAETSKESFGRELAGRRGSPIAGHVPVVATRDASVILGVMDTWDAVTSRRQVREFGDAPVDESDLKRILEAGRRAPSARNVQPWDFVVVTDPGQRKALSGVWKGAGWTSGASAVVAIVIPIQTEDRARVMNRFDLGQAAMQMTITATGLGVGSGQAACEDQDLAREVLGFPEDRMCGLLIALGSPADRPLKPIKNPDRRAFDEVVHTNRW